MPRPIRALLVGLTIAVEKALVAQMNPLGFDFITASAQGTSGVEGALVGAPVDVIVLDAGEDQGAALELLGRCKELLPGCPVIMQASPAQAGLLLEALQSGLDISIVRIDDDQVCAQLLGATMQRLLCSPDQAHRSLQIRHADKMQTVGRMTGGIAHDFNNLLTIITSYCYLLMTELTEDDDTLRPSIDKILHATERGSMLSRQLMSLGRAQAMTNEPFSLSAMIGKMEPLLQQLFGKKLTLAFDLAGELPLISCDRASLEQAVLSLVANAADAMPDGGQLDVETKLVSVEDELLACDGSIAAGDYVVLRVRDSGHGIGDAIRARIFEPFFSTKAAAAGSGLGLASVMGIVKQCEGHIHLQSAPEQGSEFTIYLSKPS
ncbi:MAG: hypothetical protein H0U74_05380 [Bradymonadaceae bacterium]|nr:hypothetical protein [Lujinxingiaceae bacterium]